MYIFWLHIKNNFKNVPKFKDKPDEFSAIEVFSQGPAYTFILLYNNVIRKCNFNLIFSIQ